MKQHLITTDEFRQLARPTSTHIDEEVLNCYIGECEDMNIIPAIGYDLYNTIVTENENLALTDEHDALLNGGVYTLSVCGCGTDETRYCHGLKKALAYYAYAKMILADGELQARSGFIEHTNDYFQHKSDKKDRYNDAMNTAESYLNSCLNYIKSVINENQWKVRTTRSHIHAIGN